VRELRAVQRSSETSTPGGMLVLVRTGPRPGEVLEFEMDMALAEKLIVPLAHHSIRCYSAVP